MATAAEARPSLELGGTEKKMEVVMENDGASKPVKEKKIGHRRVDSATGQTSYKKTPSETLSGAIQLGISHTVGGLSAKPERDVLMQDFQVVDTIMFPKDGTNQTPAHHYDDFRFKTYAPIAFRYFRDLFGIRPADYMLSISNEPLTELSNPGASGSLFFVTHDDEFIIKTVQHKEAEFLQKLLPGYYMNLVQNPRTLLPKFYGLYCIQASGRNIRVVVMNNLLPRHIKMHLKFDLKGSTFKRKASKNERAKKSPTYKDLDLVEQLPEGLVMEPEIYAALVKTMQRDCLVLRSFKIMDYSMLLAIHYKDKQAEKPAQDDTTLSKKYSSQGNLDDPSTSQLNAQGSTSGSSDALNEAERKKRLTLYSTPTDAIMSSTMLRNKYNSDLDLWAGGIPAKSSKGEKLLIFCGIIDILQCYKLKKKLEHTFKSMVYDADTVSVHRPGFYCDRFQKFMCDNVFKKAPVKTQPSKRNVQKSHTLGGGVSPYRVTASPRANSERKLQSDRPDLLPSESPRPWSAESSDNRMGYDHYDSNSQIHRENRGPERTPLDYNPLTDQSISDPPPLTSQPQALTKEPKAHTSSEWVEKEVEPHSSSRLAENEAEPHTSSHLVKKETEQVDGQSEALNVNQVELVWPLKHKYQNTVFETSV